MAKYCYMQQRRVNFHTLGCKLNFSESSTLAREFEQGGFQRVEPTAESDICVVNTCSVTESSDKKCRNLIRRLHRKNPAAIIAVTGCYAQLKPEEVAQIEGVDIVLGNNNKGELFKRVSELAEKGKPQIFSCDTEMLTSFFAAFSSGDRTRAFLKVQDGCDYKCSYCTIPKARGASRSIPIVDVVAEAQKVAASGPREIVLTGVNIGDFGRNTGERFIDLLKALNEVDGIDRYRISSIEPNLLTDEILDFCAQSPKFQPHFHIPLQSGSDVVLGLMRRRYTTAKFAERIAAVRARIPDAFIGIDVIVGFPGESDAEFETTYNFLKELAPAYLHIFPFSERPGTPATEFAGKVSPQIASERVAKLDELCQQLHRDFCSKSVGTTQEVLFESSVKGGLMMGYTNHYVRVKVPFNRDNINKICRVKLSEIDENNDLRGEIHTDFSGFVMG